MKPGNRGIALSAHWRLGFASLLLVASATAQDDPATPADEVERRRTQLKILARDARDWVDWRRLAAWEGLLDFGEEGCKVLLPIVEAKLEKDRVALAERFKATELARARKKLEAALVERRKLALACIFDVHRYPDENHGAVGQPEVDRLVELVRAAFEHPASFTRQAIPDVDALAIALEEDLAYVEACGGKLQDGMPTVAVWLDGFNAAFEVEELGINGTRHDWNVEVAKYHAEELLTSADPEELACMHATNSYRRMMGLPILEIDERLVRAARKHSQEMRELNYFAHESPVPENRSFGQRCSHEGYSGASGENIAVGMSGGVPAFQCWYNSSGHHRNILGGHQQIGVGRFESHWTQNFGGSSSLRGRKIEDPQILYLGRLKKLDPTSADSEANLAAWCRANGLEERAKEHAQRALVIDPEHERARELLGHVKQDGRRG